jgi:hypothetical protein
MRFYYQDRLKVYLKYAMISLACQFILERQSQKCHPMSRPLSPTRSDTTQNADQYGTFQQESK